MYNGQSISYDLIGNSLSYRDGMTMSWQNGRQLASLQKGTGVVNYSYDVNGRRVKKTAGGDTVSFYYDDNGRLIKQEDDGGNIWFYYNPTGAAASMSYHGTHYYFLKNLQGDVVALVNMQGDIAARYTYDAWGDIVSVTDAAGNAITDQDHVANQNPIRYRGYYYDTESGLYYLNSRYYDPVTGRFINADATLGQIGNIQGHNMYTYCFNNPVNMSDPIGNWPSWSQIFTGIAIAAVAVAAVAAVVATAGAAAPALAVAGGAAMGSAAVATAATVATGAMIVAGVSATAAVVTSVVENTGYRKPTRNQTVYKLVNDQGETRYVGRTNNPQRRARQHKKSVAKADLQMVPIATGLTKTEARAMEQIVISAYTLDNLINARREIAVGNVSGFAGKIDNVISIFGGAIEDEFLNLMGR